MIMNKRAELFFQTITPEILSPSDYIDWDTIRNQVKSLRKEIALLQSLDKENPVDNLADLLYRNPNILKVLQLLIAHTPRKIFFNDENKYIDFTTDLIIVSRDRKRAKDIALIFIEMGLVQFLNEIRSVEDVVKGVLIGLEPNSRKSRRGSKLEDVISEIISSTLEELNREKGLSLSFETQMYIDLEKERKKSDFVILQGDEQKIAIEVNFYSTSGSKPSEVLGRAYPEVQENLKKRGIGFIVITDGVGWDKMKPVISTAYKKLDFLMNIKQAISGELKKAILEFLNI